MPTRAVGAVLKGYLAGVGADAARSLVALDSAIRAARPDLDVAIKYRLVTYALGGDWRHWVCAINAQKDRVCLRFLYGVLLDDPLAVLRAGSAQLMTWDFTPGAVIDTAAVRAYVSDAVARYDYVVAHDREVNATARSVAKSRAPTRRPAGGSATGGAR